MRTVVACGEPHCREVSSSREWPNSITDHVRVIHKYINNPSALRSTSMIKGIAAITFIFLCTSFAWAILGATIFDRTYSSDNTSADRVASTWGSAQNQSPPTASVEGLLPKLELPLESSHITVDLNLEHRQKGLLWYSTY